MSQNTYVNELAVEFANNILASANQEKEVLGALDIEIPDKDMFYIYVVLWESWMFYMALGMENPPQGEEIFNKTHIQIAGSIPKITLERFMILSGQLFPLLTSSFSDPRTYELPAFLSKLFYGTENVASGFDEYIQKMTASTIDFHRKTIASVYGND
jgi:hypothetical protein